MNVIFVHILTVFLEAACMCFTTCPFCPSIYLCEGFCSKDSLWWGGREWASVSNAFCFSYKKKKNVKAFLTCVSSDP